MQVNFRNVYIQSLVLASMPEFPQFPGKFSKLESFGLIVFILTLGVSFVDTFWAVYIFEHTHSDVAVGLISALLTVVSLVSFVAFIPLFEKYDNSQLYQWSLFLMGICYALFLFTQSLWIIILLGIILSILTVIRLTCFGIILKENSTNKNLAKHVGMSYTILSLGWLVGPLLAAPIAERYGIPLLFLLSSFFFFMALLMYKILHIGMKRKKITRRDGHFFHKLTSFFHNPGLLRTYIVAGTSPLWWSFVYIYIPVYIIQQGLGVQWVAYFLFATMVPIFVLEYSFNILADRMKYRTAFVGGNLFLAVLLFICFFVTNIYVLLALLSLGSVGLALVEPAAESYFFLVAPKKDLEKNYSIYNTSLDIFGIIGKLIIAGCLVILSFAYSFLFLSLCFFFLAWVSLSLKQVSGAKH